MLNPLFLLIQPIYMNKIILLLSGFIVSMSIIAQTNSRIPEVDKSVMDISYYPVNYPILKIQNKITDPLAMRIIYSRPLKQGRKIFGELVEYGKVWRLGANEATEIEFFKDVKINGKKILKGRYTLYALVNEDKWTIIVNKETDTWGAFKYDSKKDLVRVDVPVEKISESIDTLSMVFEKSENDVNLVISWEQVRVIFPISL